MNLIVVDCNVTGVSFDWADVTVPMYNQATSAGNRIRSAIGHRNHKKMASWISPNETAESSSRSRCFFTLPSHFYPMLLFLQHHHLNIDSSVPLKCSRVLQICFHFNSISIEFNRVIKFICCNAIIFTTCSLGCMKRMVAIIIHYYYHYDSWNCIKLRNTCEKTWKKNSKQMGETKIRFQTCRPIFRRLRPEFLSRGFHHF